MSGERLTILHTNDLHGRLGPDQVGLLRQLRAAHPPALLVDAGDAVTCGNLDFKPWGEPALERMNAAGYHAMALGNREFHPWRFAQRLKIGRARFPVLCANLRPRQGNGRAGVAPATVVELAGGARVGLFGLLVEMVTPAMWAARLSHFLFDDPVPIARQWARRLRQDAHWVVCLSHLGLDRDRQLARAVPCLDAIIGGHSHTPLSRPERAGAAWIAQSQPYGRAVGRLLLGRRAGEVEGEGELVALTTPTGPGREGRARG